MAPKIPARFPPMALFSAALLIAAHLFTAPLLFAAEDDPAADPVSVYAELDGEWAGEFVGWDTAGRELYRIEVRQRYETIDAKTQKVTITDRAADGTVTEGWGRNIARRLEDGTLELRCIVEKSNGDRVEHAGRLVAGAGGDTELVWYSQTPDREEIFRERVLEENGEEIYAIDGFGRYGDTLILMAGRYRRFEDSTVEDSTRKNSTVEDSTVENRTVEDSTVEDGTVEDSAPLGESP